MRVVGFVKSPYTRLSVNFLYAVYNCVIGFVSHSWWFITVGAYYIVLAVTRFCVLKIKRKANGEYETELFAKRITGVLLTVLSVCIAGVNLLSIINDRGSVFNEIVMITIATFTFYKITMAIIGMVKARQSRSPVIKTIRNINLADACVSIYSMQRSMLKSFDGMEVADIRLLNIFTGSAVFIVVLVLGINLIGGKRIDMAKSKIVSANKKIAKSVTDGYKKIEKGVVDGYKKIEKGVVNGYTKIEDKFVDMYLTKEGETVEEAKKRLNKK